MYGIAPRRSGSNGKERRKRRELRLELWHIKALIGCIGEPAGHWRNYPLNPLELRQSTSNLLQSTATIEIESSAPGSRLDGQSLGHGYHRKYNCFTR